MDPLAVRSYLAHLRAEGISRTSIGRHLSVLRTFFAFLKREGRMASNPAKSVGTPRREKTLPRTLSVGEAGAVVDHAEIAQNQRAGRDRLRRRPVAPFPHEESASYGDYTTTGWA